MKRTAFALFLAFVVSCFAQAPRPPVDKLSQLTDVHLTSPTNTQVLTYDSATSKWINGAGGSGAVSSVFGRTGVVVAMTGDYIAAQVTNAADTTGSYANPAWITSLIWSKITSTPTTLAGYGITDAVPNTRTVNGHALSSNVTVTASDLGATTVGGNIFSLTNPSAITFLRMNADNSVSALTASAFRTAIGAGTGGGDALTANPLSQFAATTSAQLAGVISDETGSGLLVFGTSPNITTPTGIVKGDVGLGNVTNNAQTQAAIVPNTAPAAGQLLVGNAGGTAYAPATLSGSGATATLSSAGVLTLSAIPNATLSNSAITIAGTSTSLGGSITLDTISGVSSNGFLKRTSANTWTNDSSTYITGNQTITLSGDVTGSGATAITTTNVNLPDGVTQAGSLLLTDIAAPSSPAAGHLKVFGDSTDLRFHDKNAAGTIGTTVVSDTGASNNFLTAISAAGVISKAQPSYSNISGTDAPAIANVTGMATGVGTFLATSTSANLRAALTDENGTGAALFDSATSPTFITPILGTPTSGTLTNCTFPTLNQNTTGSAASLSISGQTGLMTVAGLTSTNRIKTVRDAADTILELGGSYTPTGTWTSLTMVTPVLGTPTSGDLRNCTPATDSVAGVMSAADHTTLTNLSTATATGVAPAFVGVGIPVVAFKSGVDFKNNGTTDIFTVPTSRAFVVTNAMIIPTTVSGGAAIAINWKIIESGGSATMCGGTANVSTAPATTKYWTQANAANIAPYTLCAAAAKVQFSGTTMWTTSTTVTGNVFVFGYYSQ